MFLSFLPAFRISSISASIPFFGAAGTFIAGAVGRGIFINGGCVNFGAKLRDASLRSTGLTGSTVKEGSSVYVGRAAGCTGNAVGLATSKGPVVKLSAAWGGMLGICATAPPLVSGIGGVLLEPA